MSLNEKVAYIKGLLDGLDLDTDKKETRVIKEIVELLGEMASDVEDIDLGLADLVEVVDEIDEDLGRVEEEVYFDEDMDFMDDETYEITCPHCGDIIILDEDMIFGDDISCPNCDEVIEIEIDDDCECCSHHDHGHNHEDEADEEKEAKKEKKAVKDKKDKK